jgi:serine/threonine protein kinase
MGEVCKARDARLNREVAVKVSGERFSDRFEREAHSIAALNHPNICTLYDVGPNYLVMELVEGPTLADRIEHGPLPPAEALAIARQIADALEAAHERGIVHPAPLPRGSLAGAFTDTTNRVAGAGALSSIRRDPFTILMIGK